MHLRSDAMIFLPRGMLASAVVCLFLAWSWIAAAGDMPVAAPIQALKSLYDTHPEFRANVDGAFANLHDPAASSRALWPSPAAVNPWKGKERHWGQITVKYGSH